MGCWQGTSAKHRDDNDSDNWSRTGIASQAFLIWDPFLISGFHVAQPGSHGHGAAASGLAITFTCCRRDAAVVASNIAARTAANVARSLEKHKHTHTHRNRLSGCVIRLRDLCCCCCFWCCTLHVAVGVAPAAVPAFLELGLGLPCICVAICTYIN